jgi:xylan 1,4-beta-xylosidase
MWRQHFRVDEDHSNSFEVWKKMGSPQKPAPDQYAQLEAAGQLQPLDSPCWVRAENGSVHVRFSLPLHGVSLIRWTW